ncbi:oxygen-independent coproporphyrinogen III oxidase [Marinilabiliaceae bacterium JC017]|nr:oxygen-independent coproporphyrinogen III oxidase [Marinilabiliaceae bacterium JC017]
MKINRSLIEKYNRPVPRYTSYPPANFFHGEFEQNEIQEAIEASNQQQPENISLYVHIPFCSKICHYCGCNSVTCKDQERISQYLDALKKEINQVVAMLDKKRKVSQIHWGGGTPNYLSADQISEIMALFHSHFTFIDKPEIAMECNPALLTPAFISRLKQMGFNRISLGIQDFSTKVLDTVNRDVPTIPIPELMAAIKSDTPMAVNFDFIYGLPYQTSHSIKEMLQQAIALNPDRLVTFSYAHLPQLKPAQRILEKHGLPEPSQKVEMFETAYNTMTQNGFTAIGIDHFARPEDELSIAENNNALHRNFQGYCTRRTTGQVYAFGVSAISQLHGVYFQTIKDIDAYMAAMDKKQLAVGKFYRLSSRETQTRTVINEIMCNKQFHLEDLAQQAGWDKSSFEANWPTEALREFQKDGIINIEAPYRFSFTEMGKFFVRNVAALFDPLQKNNDKQYSRSI